MNSFKKQLLTQLAIGFIILAALVAGLVFFGASIRQYSERISVARADLVSRSLSLSSLAALRTQYNTKAKDYLAFLDSYLPQRDQLINFSREVQVLASDVSGFGFSFIGEAPPTGDALGAISFVLNLQATIPQLVSFLENVDNFKYLMTIDSLSLNRQAERTMFQVPVRGRVFFR